MVRRILTLLFSEVRGLHEAAYLLGGFALLTQILALLRDRLLAHFFGAGELLDAYFAAFRLPDLLFVGVASLFSLYVLIPFLSEPSRASAEAQRALLGRVVSLFGLLMAAGAGLMFFAAPALLAVLFPDLAARSPELASLTRLLLLQPFFLGLSGIAASVTQLRGRFVLFAVGPLFYNLGIVGGILWLAPHFGLMGLGAGVVLGAALHLSVQLPFIVRAGFLPRLTPAVWSRELGDVLRLSLPRTLALSANQLALLALTALASSLAAGSIAAFNFSFNLQAVPLTIIGVSYSVAAFPTLARLFSNGERQAFLGNVATAARHIIFWSLPAAVLFIVLRAQIVRSILGSGSFSWSDTRITAAALALFSVSVLAQALVLLLTRAFYAAGSTRLPLIANVASAALSTLAALGFLALFKAEPLFRFFVESLLRVEDLPRTAMLMLPLGYSLAALLNAAVLWISFGRRFGRLPGAPGRTFFETLSAAVIMGFVAYACLDVLGRLLPLSTFSGVFFQGLIAGMLGIAAGCAVLWLLGNREVREVRESLRRKFWRASTVAPESSEPGALAS